MDPLPIDFQRWTCKTAWTMTVPPETCDTPAKHCAHTANITRLPNAAQLCIESVGTARLSAIRLILCSKYSLACSIWPPSPAQSSHHASLHNVYAMNVHELWDLFESVKRAACASALFWLSFDLRHTFQKIVWLRSLQSPWLRHLLTWLCFFAGLQLCLQAARFFSLSPQAELLWVILSSWFELLFARSVHWQASTAEPQGSKQHPLWEEGKEGREEKMNP